MPPHLVQALPHVHHIAGVGVNVYRAFQELVRGAFVFHHQMEVAAKVKRHRIVGVVFYHPDDNRQGNVVLLVFEQVFYYLIINHAFCGQPSSGTGN